MSLTRRQFLIRAGIGSVAGPAVLATTRSGAFAHFGAESPEGSLVLLPKANVNLVESDHTVTATLRPRRAGETVRFEVSFGPNVGDGADVPTDDRGRASFAYTGDGGEGLDVIAARAQGAGSSGELTATATKEWVALSAITEIDLSPPPPSTRSAASTRCEPGSGPASAGFQCASRFCSGRTPDSAPRSAATTGGEPASPTSATGVLGPRASWRGWT